MRLLAIDSATEACSAALFDNGQLIAGAYEVIGRGHAERLVPMIADLPENGRADRIVVSLGPGSFTGVRIGLAAARALGLAWGVEVLGYPTLALVAAMARAQQPGEATVCMNGGHGEWFVQHFAANGLAQGSSVSLPPEEAVRAPHAPVIAGNRAEAFASQAASSPVAIDMLPDARCVHLLDEAAFTGTLSPLYGRGPDAKLPEPPR